MIRTLEEAIAHAREVANEKRFMEDHWTKQDKDDKWHDKRQSWITECKECAKEHEQLAEWLEELKSFKEGQESRKDFIETVLSVAVAFELDELDVALYLVKRGIKLDDFKYNNDRYNYFKEFFEVHGLLEGDENG